MMKMMITVVILDLYKNADNHQEGQKIIIPLKSLQFWIWFAGIAHDQEYGMKHGHPAKLS